MVSLCEFDVKIIRRPAPSKRGEPCRIAFHDFAAGCSSAYTMMWSVADVHSGSLLSLRGHEAVPITDTLFAKLFTFNDLAVGTTAAITGVTHQ